MRKTTLSLMKEMRSCHREGGLLTSLHAWGWMGKGNAILNQQVRRTRSADRSLAFKGVFSRTRVALEVDYDSIACLVRGRIDVCILSVVEEIGGYQ